ncbi:hypothetical protein FGO68_gene9377 [Halteria grandinella]|uniref:Uncharacterized protein n=1 Tax=Halteria grandinella TaxID=5974 RepID=A0A8J8NXW5_HALGN|nr:hypothetical protein FGO68_gene9377 [Halteria grandinella]
MMELLKQIKQLFHLDIWSYEESRKIQDVVHEFSQFVIDELKELVTLNIYVFQVIEMREIQYSHRASKLTISVIYGNTSITQHIVDTRLGQRNYILQSASL